MLVEMVIDGVEVREDGSSGDLVADLLVRVAHADQRAFAELYDLLSSRVFALILKVLVNRSQSEEVLQEVFLEIWQSASKFAPNRGQGRSWIFTIAHRRAVDRVRSSQSSTDRDMRVGVRDLGGERDVVQEAVESKLEGERVVSALATLPEAQQEALILAYYGGYSQSEIAALTGVALGTIKTRMRDGLTRLRGEMGVSAA